MIRKLRQLHLFLGCFFAPLLLFFVATGWYQTLQMDRRKEPAEAESLISRLVAVHTDQIYPAAYANSWSPVLFRWLVIVMSLALIATVILGVILAIKALKQRWMVWISLTLGVLLPVVTLWLGAKR
ncbi:MAG: hypothetical protein JNN07_21810 [Verrucomicrobiales bacterium]|jgi:hypothetical protein|nr:hypothetical protein [Verrucomicrobiales bacterium]